MENNEEKAGEEKNNPEDRNYGLEKKQALINGLPGYDVIDPFRWKPMAGRSLKAIIHSSTVCTRMNLRSFGSGKVKKKFHS